MSDYKEKFIKVFNEKGYGYNDVEEIISKVQNNTRGWKCSAGIHNLYIDYDGNVFVCNNASSKPDRFNKKEWEKERLKIKEREGIDISTKENIDNGTFKKYLRIFNRSGRAFEKKIDAADSNSYKEHWGFLGNIEQGFKINKDFVTCPYETCGCGADIPIAKAVDLSLLNKIMNNDIVSDMDQLANSSITEIKGMTYSHFPTPTVLWDLGRRCNYDCSYCWPAVHNAREAHKSIKILLQTCLKIMDSLSPGREKMFCFSGGEPTLHPDIKKLLSFISKMGHTNLLTTNGSMNSDKWQELVPFIDILQLSAHFEFLNEKTYLKNLEIFLEEMSTSSKLKSIDIKLMTPPGELERSVVLRDKILAMKNEYKDNKIERLIKISFVPLRGIDDSEKVLEYSEEEVRFFSEQEH